MLRVFCNKLVKLGRLGPGLELPVPIPPSLMKTLKFLLQNREKVAWSL
jgi:hypothetical protein